MKTTILASFIFGLLILTIGPGLADNITSSHTYCYDDSTMTIFKNVSVNGVWNSTEENVHCDTGCSDSSCNPPLWLEVLIFLIVILSILGVVYLLVIKK